MSLSSVWRTVNYVVRHLASMLFWLWHVCNAQAWCVSVKSVVTLLSQFVCPFFVVHTRSHDQSIIVFYSVTWDNEAWSGGVWRVQNEGNFSFLLILDSCIGKPKQTQSQNTCTCSYVASCVHTVYGLFHFIGIPPPHWGVHWESWPLSCLNPIGQRNIDP